MKVARTFQQNVSTGTLSLHSALRTNKPLFVFAALMVILVLLLGNARTLVAGELEALITFELDKHSVVSAQDRLQYLNEVPKIQSILQNQTSSHP